MKGELLPIHEVREDIVAALRNELRARLILESPTGSGKSTQVPQILLDNDLAGNGEIVVLQPRRIAARMLAKRVAAERAGNVGDEIGYQVRFERVTGRNTRICYVTEGVLLRRLLKDPQLAAVSAIIFDEFHERHLQGDVMLAMSLALQEGVRPDLKIIVMSATLDSDALERHLEPCRVVSSEGRAYPVEIKYFRPRTSTEKDVWDMVAAALREEVIRSQLSGDVLVFLPGAYEIRRTMDVLQRMPQLKGFELRALYGQLSSRDQDAAMMPSKARKIVIATNVAETSLTIEGIRVVIDSGLARVAAFDPRRGINTLKIEKISRASADQRAGRAGRTASGVCIRLWSQRDHGVRQAALAPEIARLDLSETLLSLKAAGIAQIEEMRWLDPPEPGSLERALLLLKNLGAIDRDLGSITATGCKMVNFPAHPRFSRMLVEAEGQGCLAEAALCAALCQGRDLFLRGRKGSAARFSGTDDRSDFMPLIRAWLFAQRSGFDVSRCDSYDINASVAREVGSVMQHFLRAAGLGKDALTIQEGEVDAEKFAKVVLSGFSDNVARRRSAGTLSCEVVGGRRAKLRKESTVTVSEIVVAAEITEIEGRELNVILGKVSGVELDWLSDLYPHDVEKFERCEYDTATRRVVNERGERFRDLVLYSKQSGEAPKDKAAEVLAEEVVSGRLLLKGWNAKCMDWVARVGCLRKKFPELEFPEFDEESRLLVITEACHGGTSYKQIKDRPVWPALSKWLSPMHAASVEALAPGRIKLGNGREVKVTYLDGEPKISMVLQRLYDVHETPVIGNGKIPVVVEILGPNQRPVQRTRDLVGFWENSYPEIRKQLKGRYPKHEWR
jgi:ATP-dependent helicase HrpB